MPPVPRGGAARTRAVALLLSPLLAALLIAGPASAAPLDRTETRAPVSAEAPAEAAFAATVPPTVTGEAVVGQVLSAVAPTWSETGVETSYRWLRDDVPVAGAPGDSLLLTAADVGHALSVEATGTLGGAEPVTVVSPPTEKVRKIGSLLEVSAGSPDQGVVLLTVTVWAADDSAVAGTLEVAEGSASVAPAVAVVDGRAVVTLTRVSPGSHTYAVAYRGTDRVDGATQNVTVEVRGPVAPALTVSASSPGIGKAQLVVRVIAPGESPVGGTLDVREKNTIVATLSVVDGTATYSPSGLTPGGHDYQVHYRGTSRILAADASVSVTVRDRTVSALAVTGSSAAVGKLVLRIGVTAAGAKVSGGTVTIKEGSTTVATRIAVSNGAASWSASGLRSGRHTYTVAYSGTTTVKPASVQVPVTVQAKVKPTIGLTGTSPSAGKVSLTITVTAAGQSSLGGTVKVKEGGKTLKTITVSRGKASWSASKVKPGKHTYNVAYSGTSQVTTGSATRTVTVRKPVTVKEYANCDAMHKDYPHGVGRSGAEDEVTGDTEPVTTFFVSTALYKANTKSDRDKDGVACEKR